MTPLSTDHVTLIASVALPVVFWTTSNREELMKRLWKSGNADLPGEGLSEDEEEAVRSAAQEAVTQSNLNHLLFALTGLALGALVFLAGCLAGAQALGRDLVSPLILLHVTWVCASSQWLSSLITAKEALWKIDLGYLFFITMASSCPLWMPSQEALLVSIWRAPGLARLLLSMAFRRPKIVAVGHAMGSFIDIYTLVHGETGNGLLGQPALGLAFSELTLIPLSCLIPTLVQQAVWLAEYNRHHAAAVQAKAADAKSLLGMTCDLVLETDEDLVITKGSAEAAQLFGGGGKPSSATSLDKFFSENDAGLLRRRLICSSTQGTGVGTFYAQTQDSFGIPMSMEMFFVSSVQTTFSHARHLIGLREVSAMCSGTPSEVPKTKVTVPRAPKPKSDKGTTPQAESGTLGAQASEADFSPKQKWRNRTNPGLQLTAESVKLSSQLHLIKHWNSNISPSVCCPLHANLHEAEGIIRTLKRRKCQSRESFGLNMGDEPCKSCNMVNFSEDLKDHKHACKWCVKIADDVITVPSCSVPVAEFFPRY